jgi:hypothetical protein
MHPAPKAFPEDTFSFPRAKKTQVYHVTLSDESWDAMFKIGHSLLEFSDVSDDILHLDRRFG